MRLRIAVTDNDWFHYLRSLPNVDEVNFWQPSGERTFLSGGSRQDRLRNTWRLARPHLEADSFG